MITKTIIFLAFTAKENDSVMMMMMIRNYDSNEEWAACFFCGKWAHCSSCADIDDEDDEAVFVCKCSNQK